jgi:uncharacterized membrane protein YesL
MQRSVDSSDKGTPPGGSPTARLWRRGADGRISRAPERSPAETTPPSSESLLRTLGRALRGAYDYLGSTLLLSVVWCLVALAALLGGWALGLGAQGVRGRELASWLLEGAHVAAPGVVSGDLGRFWFAAVVPLALWSLVAAPMTGGLFAYVRDIVAHEHPVWTDVGSRIREVLQPAVRLGLIQAGVTLLLATDAFFFLVQPALGVKVVGLLFLYPLLFWLLAVQYQWPLLVEQRQGAWLAIKKSVLLTLDNPGRTLLFGLAGFVVSLLCAGSMVGVPLVWAGTLAFLQTEATRSLLRKYGVLPAEPEVDDGGDVGWSVE